MFHCGGNVAFPFEIRFVNVRRMMRINMFFIDRNLHFTIDIIILSF